MIKNKFGLTFWYLLLHFPSEMSRDHIAMLIATQNYTNSNKFLTLKTKLPAAQVQDLQALVFCHKYLKTR